ncbi:MAG: TraR/DksA C4-type zinc finger protein [Pseudonocardia sp.]|nr:TraR/DksA C4-type zinc finger protein [Pseudonocardia sp.]
MDLDHARKLLTAELADLDERARFAEQTRSESSGDTEEGALGQHPGDHGSEVAGAMDSELLVDTVADQRRSVQEALGRVEDGSYGRCAVCGEQIDDERLDARPEVRTCREHADASVVS